MINSNSNSKIRVLSLNGKLMEKKFMQLSCFYFDRLLDFHDHHGYEHDIQMKKSASI
jgi:hypothetical protein